MFPTMVKRPSVYRIGLGIASVCIVSLCANTAFAGEPKEETRAVKEKIETVRGETFAVPAPDAKATVLLFVTTDCPVANQYAPEIRRIAKKYEPKGVVFARVYADAALGTEDIAKHSKDYSYPKDFAAIHDPKQVLVRATGARVTPEAAVVNARGELVYRGRIDDRYVDFGKYRQVAEVRDLRLALDAVLAGKPIENPRTESVGCFIPMLKKSEPEEVDHDAEQ